MLLPISSSIRSGASGLPYYCAPLVCVSDSEVIELLAVWRYNKPNQLWEGNGNSHSHNSDTVMRMGREPGIFLWKKNCPRQLPASAGNFFFGESLASRRSCLRGFLTNFLGVPVSQKKQAFFRWTIQIIMTLTPASVFWYWESFHSLTKKCPW